MTDQFLFVFVFSTLPVSLSVNLGNKSIFIILVILVYVSNSFNCSQKSLNEVIMNSLHAICCCPWILAKFPHFQGSV